jgi:hypothetical protein
MIPQTSKYRELRAGEVATLSYQSGKIMHPCKEIEDYPSTPYPRPLYFHKQYIFERVWITAISWLREMSMAVDSLR